MQVEYAADVVFRRQAVFQPLYQAIVCTAVHVARVEHVAMFLGHKLSGHFQVDQGTEPAPEADSNALLLSPRIGAIWQSHPGCFDVP